MNTNHNDIKKDFKNIFNARSEEKEIKHDAFILMSAFLSEIEFIQDQRKITRKELAERIGVKAPYLTQVFRNNKPLNFYTLAKIKRVLGITFNVIASSKETKAASVDEIRALEGNSFYKMSETAPIEKGTIAKNSCLWVASKENTQSGPTGSLTTVGSFTTNNNYGAKTVSL